MNITLIELSIAMEAGGGLDRGVLDKEQAIELISQRLATEDGDPSHLGDLLNLAHSFKRFAEDVRAAALKDRPIIPVLGENIPARK